MYVLKHYMVSWTNFVLIVLMSRIASSTAD